MRPSGLMTAQAVEAHGAADEAAGRNADAAHFGAALLGRALCALSHWNCSAPRSSASLMNALVMYGRLPFGSRARWALCLRDN